MIRKPAPLIINKKAFKTNPLVKHLAALIIQSFYKRYVHWDRDPDSGLPLDPISREPIKKANQTRIIYKTFKIVHNQIVITGRVQIFDIEWLWLSILKTNKHVPINPLTNTRFTETQFLYIIDCAVKAKIIPANSGKKAYNKYKKGLCTIEYSSQYEATDWNLLKNRLLITRKRLIKFLLDQQTNDFIDLLEAQSAYIEKNLFLINQMTPNQTGRFNYMESFNLTQLATAMGDYHALIKLLEFGGALTQMVNSFIFPIHIALYEGHIELLAPIMMYGGALQLDYVSSLGSTLDLAEKLVEQHPNIYQILYATIL